MSFKDERVKLKEDEVYGHETDSMKKHLTMKYNMKDLRKLADFENWVQESLEDLVPDDGKRPSLETTQFLGLSDDKLEKQLNKILASAIKDEESRHSFIDEYITRMRKLPKALMESL